MHSIVLELLFCFTVGNHGRPSISDGLYDSLVGLETDDNSGKPHSAPKLPYRDE
jgi:hypothetical protein